MYLALLTFSEAHRRSTTAMISYNFRGVSIFHLISQFDAEIVRFCDASTKKCKPEHTAFFVNSIICVAITYPASLFYEL